MMLLIESPIKPITKPATENPVCSIFFCFDENIIAKTDKISGINGRKSAIGKIMIHTIPTIAKEKLAIP